MLYFFAKARQVGEHPYHWFNTHVHFSPLWFQQIQNCAAALSRQEQVLFQEKTAWTCEHHLRHPEVQGGVITQGHRAKQIVTIHVPTRHVGDPGKRSSTCSPSTPRCLRCSSSRRGVLFSSACCELIAPAAVVQAAPAVGRGVHFSVSRRLSFPSSCRGVHVCSSERSYTTRSCRGVHFTGAYWSYAALALAGVC